MWDWQRRYSLVLPAGTALCKCVCVSWSSWCHQHDCSASARLNSDFLAHCNSKFSQGATPNACMHHDRLTSAVMRPVQVAAKSMREAPCPLSCRKQDRSIGPMSSDSLLPLFIAALIVAQPLHLHACLDYVKRFHFYGDWAGQTGFQVHPLRQNLYSSIGSRTHTQA